MASITIRQIDERTKQRLRLSAAQHRTSMEEEVRRILRAALGVLTHPGFTWVVYPGTRIRRAEFTASAPGTVDLSFLTRQEPAAVHGEPERQLVA